MITGGWRRVIGGGGGSEDLSREITSELIFDRQGGVGHGKLQELDCASKGVTGWIGSLTGAKGFNTATQLSAGSVGNSLLSLTPSQGFCHMLPSQYSLSISLAKS